MNWTNIFAELHDSEINFEISSFFDNGLTVRLGDNMNGFIDESDVVDMEEAAYWLRDIAIKKYPNSTFAKNQRHAKASERS